ncbi:MAG: hypothetical protein ACK4UP_02540 [Spirosomataceae bacterium]
MTKTVARFLSTLFHPLFIPTLVLTLAFSFYPTLMGINGAFIEIRLYVLLFILFYTCILPGGFILWLSKRKLISSYSLSNLKDRRIPYFATAIIYGLFAYLVYNQARAMYATSLFLFSTAAVILLLGLISFWWQISAHAAGVGGWIGFLLILLVFQEKPLIWPFIFSFPIAGAVLSSRLHLQVHTPAQVWTGFAIGALVQMGGWLFFR